MRCNLPPLWLFASLLVMTALHFVIPAWAVVPRPYNFGGAVPIVIGLSLVGWPALMFRRARTTIKPFRESTTLITSGPFRFSRNPIYVGLVLVLLGFAILLGSLTPFVVVPMFAILIDRVFIVREERMLSEAFPDDYEDYCRRVRRWI
jgi:protein-S-isoprenylcysteine O-methyltransferase Ste14